METKYYIYHIPTYVHVNGMIGKIGVSEDLKTRIRFNLNSSEQPFDFWEVLEEHTDIMEVSRREIELQKQYGYKVDKKPYWQSRNMGKTGEGGKIGGKHTSPNGGKIGGRIAVESGQIFTLCKANRKLTFKDAQLIRELCVKKTHSQRKLAKMYNVSNVTIWNIINNKSYTQP
jgi:transposase